MNELLDAKRADIHLIDPRRIIIQEGFNVRQIFELEELKDQIKEFGVLNPISVIAEGKGDEVRYRLVDGERRVRATLAAIEEGAPIARIKAIFLSRNAKEENLCLEQVLRNEGKPFSEYEYGLMYERFRDRFGYTQAEIAAKFKKSPSHVSQCLNLVNLPGSIQESLGKGEISASAVKQIVRESGSEEEQEEKVKEAVATAQQENRKATAKDVKVTVSKEEKQAKQLADLLCELTVHTRGDVVVSISDLILSLREKKSIAEAWWNLQSYDEDEVEVYKLSK